MDPDSEGEREREKKAQSIQGFRLWKTWMRESVLLSAKWQEHRLLVGLTVLFVVVDVVAGGRCFIQAGRHWDTLSNATGCCEGPVQVQVERGTGVCLWAALTAQLSSVAKQRERRPTALQHRLLFLLKASSSSS